MRHFFYVRVAIYAIKVTMQRSGKDSWIHMEAHFFSMDCFRPARLIMAVQAAFIGQFLVGISGY